MYLISLQYNYDEPIRIYEQPLGVVEDRTEAAFLLEEEINNQISQIKTIDKKYQHMYDIALAQYRSHVKLGTPKPKTNTMDDAINWRKQQMENFRNIIPNLPELWDGSELKVIVKKIPVLEI